MYLLEVDPLDLGPDVKAVGLELIDSKDREPVRGEDAARIWAATLTALAGAEPWALDFFSHMDRVRDYCSAYKIAFREAATRSLVVPVSFSTGAASAGGAAGYGGAASDRGAASSAPTPEKLVALFERFAGETFGARAGAGVAHADSELEGELSRRGVDGYHAAYARYFFCGVCDFESGFLTLLTNRLWAGEVVRRLTPVLKDLTVRVQVPV